MAVVLSPTHRAMQMLAELRAFLLGVQCARQSCPQMDILTCPFPLRWILSFSTINQSINQIHIYPSLSNSAPYPIDLLKPNTRTSFAMALYASNSSNTSTNSTSTRRLCPHGSYGPLCICTSRDTISSAPLSPPNSATQVAAPKPSTSSTSRLCPHGSYGPLCICTSVDTTSSAPLSPSSSAAQAADIQAEPTVSLGDHIRAVLGIKVHKLCSHGSYGPTCICNLKAAA
jgi:hypothetical protein